MKSETAVEPSEAAGANGAGAAPPPPDDIRLDLGDLLNDAPLPLDDLEPGSPPLVDEQGRVRLSFSRIDLYRSCGLRFRYAYVDKLPTAPATYLSFGTSIHAALEAFHERTLFGRPTLDDLHQFLYDNWDSSGYAHVPREKQIEDYKRAKLVLTRYHQRVGDAYRPAADTEKWFELPVGDTAVVVGSIDRIDVDDAGDYHVVDYKTGKLRDVESVRKSLQLALYALACEHLYGRLPASVSLDFVVAGTEVRVPVEELDLAAAKQAVLDTADAVLAERYEPNPTRLCDWCDHRALCPAWEGPDPSAFGPAVVRLTQLRRQVQRDVAELRALEAAVEHGRQALLERGLDPVVTVAAGDLPDDQTDVGADDAR